MIMSGLEVFAVVACVAGVVSAYHDGTNLVRRIKDKRAWKRSLEEEKTRSLEGSLELGPPIVQGQYDQNFQRWGDRYAQGDQIARESLKDVIITLQSALLMNLQNAWADDVEIDYTRLQIVSDESRVKAVLTLCQLYQRLSVESPIHAPLQAVPAQGTQQSFGRASTVSSMGSMPPISPVPTPPRLSYVSSASTASFPQPTTPDPTQPLNDSFARLNVQSPQRQPPPVQTKSSGSGNSLRRIFNRRPNPQSPASSTTTSTSTLHAPYHYQSHLHPEHEAASIRSTDPLLKAREQPKTQADQISIGSSDRTSTVDSMYWGPEDINPWAEQRPSTDSTPVISVPQRRVTGDMEVVVASPQPVENVISTSLYLPSEENRFAGFCKGAWKLQLGLKKAMTPEYRPSGMYGQISYWRCQKCCYEGPMMGKDKASRSFDNRLRQSHGIRYRWVFLAKSHTYTRTVAKNPDGAVGTYGCIFCCAELRRVPPMFGNVESLMQHLQEHRDRPPTGELLYRTKCIVGRIAGPEEDFDINLPPRVQETRQ